MPAKFLECAAIINFLENASKIFGVCKNFHLEALNFSSIFWNNRSFYSTLKKRPEPTLEHGQKRTIFQNSTFGALYTFPKSSSLFFPFFCSKAHDDYISCTIKIIQEERPNDFIGFFEMEIRMRHRVRDRAKMRLHILVFIRN